ncbi:MAG TPA: hypothetical protein VIJ29_01145 [Candidatus Paceibacterota bacterium]
MLDRVKRLWKKIWNGEIIWRFFPERGFYYLSKKYQKELRSGKPFIVRFEYGGLGDHLTWSSIPKLVYEKYGVKMGISKSSEFRSNNIREFVWGKNPYTYVSDEPGKSYGSSNYGGETYNEINQRLFGVEGELFNLYYAPKERPEVKNKTVCDFTFASAGVQGYEKQEFWDSLVTYLRSQKGQLMLICREENDLISFVKKTLGLEVVYYHSIEELADLIHSAENRIFLGSGARSLAAAYNLPSTIVDTKTMNSIAHLFQYPSGTYIVL